MVSKNITPSRDSDNEQDLAFIRDLPNELILYIYELLPKNFVLDFWFPPVPELNVFLRMQNLNMPPSLKRWLLERVFVCSPKTKYVFNWQNHYLNSWLLLSPDEFDQLKACDLDWFGGQIMVEIYLKYYKMYQKYEYTKKRFEAMTIPLCIRSVLDVHLHQLVLTTIDDNIRHYKPKLKVDCLQIQGFRHDVSLIVDVSSVRQLIFHTKHPSIHRQAQNFTLLTDLQVRFSSDYSDLLAFSHIVRRLVLTNLERVNYQGMIEMAANFRRLIYCEFAMRGDVLTFPRIWRMPEEDDDKERYAEVVAILQSKHFKWLETFVLDDHAFKVERRDGEWVSSKEVTENNELVCKLVEEPESVVLLPKPDWSHRQW